MTEMEEIYRQHAVTVYRYLLSMTHDESLAEELTQETFYQAVRTLDRYDGSCAVSTWLCAVAKNVFRRHCRKHPETVEIQAWDLPGPGSDETVLASAERVDVLRRLHLLPEPGREIMYLRIYGTLAFREIGEIFGKSENWARVTYYRARERLRKEFEHDKDSM